MKKANEEARIYEEPEEEIVNDAYWWKLTRVNR
jgi:hypothetical protein